MYPLAMTNSSLLKMAIEMESFPVKNCDFSKVFCMFTRGGRVTVFDSLIVQHVYLDMIRSYPQLSFSQHVYMYRQIHVYDCYPCTYVYIYIYISSTSYLKDCKQTGLCMMPTGIIIPKQ